MFGAPGQIALFLPHSCLTSSLWVEPSSSSLSLSSLSALSWQEEMAEEKIELCEDEGGEGGQQENKDSSPASKIFMCNIISAEIIF